MSRPEPRTSMQSIIKHDRVRVEAHDSEVPSALPARARDPEATKRGARCKKSVQLLRENNVVHAVEVHCSCGEITLVEFEYGPGTATEIHDAS